MSKSRYHFRNLLRLPAVAGVAGMLLVLAVAGMLLFLGYQWGCGSSDSDRNPSLIIVEELSNSDLSGKVVTYEDMIGTWVLTTESRLNLDEFLHTRLDSSKLAETSSIKVTQFSLMIVLSGRHFSLYNREYLVGTIRSLPTLSNDVWVARNPFDADRVWQKDRTGVRLADSRLLGHGLDLPVKAVIWALREPLSGGVKGFAGLRSSEQLGSLVMREEANPDMWSELYYDIILKESRLRLQRVLVDVTSEDKLILEWLKVK